MLPGWGSSFVETAFEATSGEHSVWRRKTITRLTSATANAMGVATAASDTPASRTTFVPGGVCCSTSANTLAACTAHGPDESRYCARAHGSDKSDTIYDAITADLPTA